MAHAVQVSLAFAGEKFLIHRRAENRECLAPVENLRELLPRHPAREEKILGLFAKARDHVLLRRVVFVAGRNRVAVHFKRTKELEHVLDFRHVGLLIDGRVGGDLVAENLRHLDRLNALLEHAFTLDNEVVREFQAVHVDVPIHPFRRADDHFAARRGIGLADGFGVLVGNQFLIQQFYQHRLNGRRVNRGEVIPHFLPHEQGVRADVNDAVLPEQAGDEFLDLRINQRFTAANADHRRVTFHRRREALFQRHHVLERRGIFADAPATGAGEIARVQRFELQHHGKLRRLAQFVFDDVTGDFLRQRKWKSHNLFYGNNLGGDLRE